MNYIKYSRWDFSHFCTVTDTTCFSWKYS